MSPCTVYCADVGSIRKGNFGWAHSSQLSGADLVNLDPASPSARSSRAVDDPAPAAWPGQKSGLNALSSRLGVLA
jgi:hypothetical protein